jgi:hypothetical protein
LILLDADYSISDCLKLYSLKMLLRAKLDNARQLVERFADEIKTGGGRPAVWEFSRKDRIQGNSDFRNVYRALWSVRTLLVHNQARRFSLLLLALSAVLWRNCHKK